MLPLVKVEGSIAELKQLFLESAKEEAKQVAKKAGKKAVRKVVKTAKRAPSAYNKFMKKELKRLKRLHPRTKQSQLMKKAAKGWRKKK